MTTGRPEPLDRTHLLTADAGGVYDDDLVHCVVPGAEEAFCGGAVDMNDARDGIAPSQMCVVCVSLVEARYGRKVAGCVGGEVLWR